ncbi:MAG: hypothetical protein ACOCX2_12115 [Armatimonadota bacterium]
MRSDRLLEMLMPVVSEHIKESASTLFMVARTDGLLEYANPGARALLGLAKDGEEGRGLWDLLTEAEVERVREVIEDGIDGVKLRTINFVSSEGLPETLACRMWMHDGRVAILGESDQSEALELRQKLIETNNEHVVNSRELTRRTRELEHARERLQAAVEELENSYWHLKKIQEVLPICMGCEKVKTSDATWEDVVDYLQQNALFLSHGYCPDCAEKMIDQYHMTGEKESAE